MSKGSRKSRLDKLICLLEESKDKTTLQNAAHKVRDVVCQHPEQLPSVLGQIHSVLYSHSWLSRVFAGETLGYIATSVQHRSPEQLAELAGTSPAEPEGHVLDVVAQFDVDALLLCEDPFGGVEQQALQTHGFRNRCPAQRVQQLLRHFGLPSTSLHLNGSTAAETQTGSKGQTEEDETQRGRPQGQQETLSRVNAEYQTLGPKRRKRKAGAVSAQQAE